jgi:hypothetical protein
MTVISIFKCRNGCGQWLYYDSRVTSPKTGKNIPLGDCDDKPHRCPLYNKAYIQGT